jgi:hypothetical protein
LKTLLELETRIQALKDALEINVNDFDHDTIDSYQFGVQAKDNAIEYLLNLALNERDKNAKS